jgi:hypothetical protein
MFCEILRQKIFTVPRKSADIQNLVAITVYYFHSLAHANFQRHASVNASETAEEFLPGSWIKHVQGTGVNFLRNYSCATRFPLF